MMELDIMMMTKKQHTHTQRHGDVSEAIFCAFFSQRKKERQAAILHSNSVGGSGAMNIIIYAKSNGMSLH